MIERSPMPHDEEVNTLGLAVLGVIAPEDILRAEAIFGAYVPEDEITTDDEAMTVTPPVGDKPYQDPSIELLEGALGSSYSVAANILGDAFHWAPSEIADIGEKLRAAFIEAGLADSDREMVQWATSADIMDIIGYAYKVAVWVKEAGEV